MSLDDAFNSRDVGTHKPVPPAIQQDDWSFGELDPRGAPSCTDDHIYASAALLERTDGQPYEVHFKTEYDIINFTARPTTVETAFDSDLVAERFCIPFGMAYYPAGSEVFLRRQHWAGPNVSLAVNPNLTRQVFGDRGINTVPERIVFRYTSPKVKYLTAAFLDLFEDPNPPSDMMVASMAIMAATSVAEAVGAPPSAEKKGKKTLQYQAIQRARDYIQDHLGDALSMQQLAQEAGMSASAFSRNFRQIVGQGPCAFVVAARVDKARLFLEEGILSLAEIAFQCGFSSQSHFSNTFRKHLGVTPGQYRQGV
ncbi:MAG: AraC family transcriptional regulator [Pseudomonadota bacterium]